MTKQSYITGQFGKELHDIVEELNYSNIICKVNPDEYDKLEKVLKADHCSHMYELEYVKRNNLFYIENCDLQYCTTEDLKEISEYIICNISFTDKGFIIKPVGVK